MAHGSHGRSALDRVDDSLDLDEARRSRRTLGATGAGPLVGLRRAAGATWRGSRIGGGSARTECAEVFDEQNLLEAWRWLMMRPRGVTL